jgi:uncharacterized membrane protein YdbT with pleckstrin-like domain
MEQPSQPPKQPHDPHQPVAYDSEGRPLYAAPQVHHQPDPGPQVVHVSRAISPEKPPISPEIQKKHEESVHLYPFLNLSDAEYVISAVRRHPIGLILPAAITIFLIAFVASLLINYDIMIASFGVVAPPPYEIVLLCGTLLIFLFLVGGYIAVWVYLNNKFFLTNESVIQEIQTSLFSKHEQTVSLTNIEDASFRQQGIIQSMFDYGSIRLSTEGDETTYRFNYVTAPKKQIAILNNAVEAFKNGRPVDDSDN